MFRPSVTTFGSNKAWMAAKFPMILTLVENVICTGTCSKSTWNLLLFVDFRFIGLIAGRLWRVKPDSSENGTTENSNAVSRAIVIIVESGVC